MQYIGVCSHMCNVDLSCSWTDLSVCSVSRFGSRSPQLLVWECEPAARRAVLLAGADLMDL